MFFAEKKIVSPEKDAFSRGRILGGTRGSVPSVPVSPPPFPGLSKRILAAEKIELFVRNPSYAAELMQGRDVCGGKNLCAILPAILFQPLTAKGKRQGKRKTDLPIRSLQKFWASPICLMPARTAFRESIPKGKPFNKISQVRDSLMSSARHHQQDFSCSPDFIPAKIQPPDFVRRSRARPPCAASASRIILPPKSASANFPRFCSSPANRRRSPHDFSTAARSPAGFLPALRWIRK